MKLIEVVEANPDAFYAQSWWLTQRFAMADRGPLLTMPPYTWDGDPAMLGFQPYAATLALLFVSHPADDLWKRFVWTCDFDDHGNRVYVAGLGQEGIHQFQIHRALKDLDITNGVWQ